METNKCTSSSLSQRDRVRKLVFRLRGYRFFQAKKFWY
ncbi:hypothetical protein Dform_00016 [Dehalogenimonas formicexedens]|uniref:Uncharacterized protein n=1 Tax=Dehalogenimonas formicexedens TaxID=1839801 RepID=A0A1P8F4U4_9CHLR|nr:hypothetical protein Dform_00016 [Dehalogenimonas formicexedens]